MNPLDFLNTTNYPSSFLEGTFGDKFYSQSVEPAKLGTGPKPPLGQVAKNWNPLKAFTPKMLATGPTPAASKFLGSNIAYGLPFAYAGGADLLQDRLEKQGLTGEGGIYDVSGGWGPEAAGADVEYDFDNIYNDDNEPGTIDVSDPRFNQAGIGIISGLNKLFGPKIASYLKNKAITKGVQKIRGPKTKPPTKTPTPSPWHPGMGGNGGGGGLGKGVSPTGSDVEGTPFNMGGLARLLYYGGLV